MTAAEVLVGLGALSLVAAVTVFAAVSWSELAAWAQGALIVGLTGAVLAVATACRRRDLVATSESLGAVGVALGLADVHVARVALDGVIPDRATWAGGVALVALGLLALGRRSRIRVLGLAGGALAFAPLVVATSGSAPLVWTTALAVQAVVGGVLTARLADRRPERVVAGIGSLLSWTGAVAAALAVAATGLAADAVAHPVGPALVLAGLAGATIAGGRRLRVTDGAEPDVLADAVGAAGTALALAPAVLLAASAGSLDVMLAVIATQSVLAGVVAASTRPSVAERAVAAVGGSGGGGIAALGAVAVGIARALDGTTPLAPAAILAALAVAAVVLGRRPTGPDRLGGAGAIAALAPAVLLALATRTFDVVLAVLAVEAVVALALAGTPLLTRSERVAASLGGWGLGIASATGALLHLVADLTRDPDDVGARVGALAVLAGLAAASVAIGTRTDRRSLTASGAGLAFLPVPLAVVGGWTPTVLVVVLLGQALVAALLATIVAAGPARTVVRAGGATAWVLAVAGAGLMGLAGWLATPVVGPAGSVALLVALAVLAVGASLRGGWERTAMGAGLGSAVVPLLLAVSLAAGGLGLDGWVAAVLAGAAAIALGAGTLHRIDGSRPWTAPWGVALVAGAGLVIAPVRSVLGVASALVDSAVTAPDVGSGVTVADWLRPALTTAGLPVPGWAVLAQVLAAAGLAGAVALVHPRLGRVLAALAAVVAVVLVPVATGVSVAVAVGGLGAVVVAAACAVRRRPRDPELLVAATATIVLGTGLAIGSVPWTVGWTVVVGLVVAGLAVEVVARRSDDAPTWVGVAGATVLGGVALDAWALGATGAAGLLAVAVTAAALSPAAAVLDRRGPARAADVVDLLVALALAGVLVAVPVVTGTVLSLSPFVALAGATATGAALRTRRRAAWSVAGASAVVLVWLEAGRAEVEVVEAFTVPLALWLLAVGVVALRGRGSWERFGAALLTAAGPTTVLALLDPDPVRTVAVVALGSALAVWGAATRLQAPLTVGAAAVAALAVRHLGPVGVDLPRYVAFALAGLVLLAVGATFEQRRQDVRQARDAFVRLR